MAKTTTKKPTIMDVAREANAGLGTVSRYLNGTRIRADNQERIEKAILRLGFEADPVARAMKSNKTKMLGFVSSTFHGFNGGILTHLVAAMRPHGYTILAFSHAYEENATREALRSAAERRIDGLVFSGGSDAQDAVSEVQHSDIPIVIFNNDIEELDVDRVLVNDAGATRDAVTQMIAMGHRRIGFVCGNLEMKSAEDRLSGYSQALSDAGLELDPGLVVEGLWSRDKSRRATETLLSAANAPTAIFYSSRTMTMGGLEFFQERGVVPGTDIGIVSFADSDVFRFHSPPIAAIEQPEGEMAEKISSMLLSRLGGEAPITGRTCRLTCTFHLRPSLAPISGGQTA